MRNLAIEGERDLSSFGGCMDQDHHPYKQREENGHMVEFERK